MSLTRLKSRRARRASLYADNRYTWNLNRTPKSLTLLKRSGQETVVEHPAHRNAIFVVHGIGEQQWTDTAATLHSGFEDALEDIAEWQEANQTKLESRVKGDTCLPPPFVLDGYWGDYPDLASTFPEDYERFEEREQRLFSSIWKQRAVSIPRTLIWFLHAQLRLLKPTTLQGAGLHNWLLYVPLQVVAATALIGAFVRSPRLLAGFLNDVRLYVDPRGVVERSIVQRIDRRVAQRFMRMIGMGLDFRPLPENDLLHASDEPVRFRQIVWVAHSLGTVISYNVLASLFEEAARLEQEGDRVQQAGVKRFRSSLVRFITMGSPLDKVALLFGEQALRPWPTDEREKLLDASEEVQYEGGGEERDWWINFYHVMDPVSGSLEHPLICGGRPPINRHGRRKGLPGLAHVDYWRDNATLRFILSRTYGPDVLQDQELKPWPAAKLRLVAVGAYLVWAALIVAVVYLLLNWAPDAIRALFN